MKKLKRILASCALIAATACAQEQIPFQAEGYNKALEDYGNKQILLNAVRASHRMPMYFSQVGDITVGDTTNAEFDLKFPLTNLALGSIAATPSAKFKTGITNYTLTPLNKKKFIETLHEPIPIKTIAYYINAGWRPELVANLLLRNIRIKKSLHSEINRRAEAICSSPRDNHEDGLCHEIDRTQKLFREYRTSPNDYHGCRSQRLIGQNRDIIEFGNHGRDPCRFIPFQNLVRQLVLLDADFVFQSGLVNDDGKVTYTDKNEAKRLRPDSAALKIPGFKDQIDLRLDDADQSVQRPGIAIRSPQGVIYYLGELIGAEEDHEPKYQPSIVLRESGRTARIFVVKKSLPGTVRGVSSVHYDGTVYFVPSRNEAGVEHRSTTSLTMAKQLIEAAIDDSDIGKVQTILTTSTN